MVPRKARKATDQRDGPRADRGKEFFPVTKTFDVAGFATLSYFQGRQMISDSNAPSASRDESFPRFLTEDDWQHVVSTLELSPQQARILGLILQGRQDKEISAKLGLNRYTIRAYLRRVFDRT